MAKTDKRLSFSSIQAEAVTISQKLALPFVSSSIFRNGLLLTCAFCLLVPSLRGGTTSQNTGRSKTADEFTDRDGQHDFDFAAGRWKTHLSRLKDPLTGSTTWIQYEGTSVVRKVWNGRANLEEFEAIGSAGHIEGLTLRLYNPQSRQWNQSWSTSTDGSLSLPMIGDFHDGRGEFYDQESFRGRMIYVRWVWSEITPSSCRFEQSFSADGGKTWEVNWINLYTRVGDIGEDKK